jgi:hypothetical protein
VTEGNSGTVNAIFTVTLSAASGQTVTVDYATANGTASAPADYVSNSGSLTFLPGDLTKTITVAVNGDTLDEANETYTVTLSNAVNAGITDGSGAGSITDDDAAPNLTINDQTVTEGNSGTVNAIFTVTLSAASGQTVTVDYATANGTASAPADYVSNSGSLTFLPGDLTKTITVAVNGDTLSETNETFTVTLSAPTNATIGDGTGLGTITDDDGALTPTTTATPTTSLTPSTFGQSVTFTTTVSGAGGPPTGTVTFYDNGVALGTATLSAGSASLPTTAVAAGTRSITATYNGNATFAPSTSGALTQTVNKATTTTAATVSPTTRQYSDREAFEATVTPTSVAGQAPATSVTFKIGTQVMGTAPLVLSGGVLKATLSNIALVEPTSPSGQLAPGTRMVTAVFNEVSPNFTVSNPVKTLTISKEDGRVTYTGPATVKTGCPTCSTATIPLSASVKDISITADAAGDVDAGDISKANVAFVNRSTGATIAIVNVTPTDLTSGTVTYNWNVDIGANASQSFSVGFIVGNYYLRNSSTDNVTVVVSKP